MSAYLKFFELNQSPFEGKAQRRVVLGTRALRDAFGTIRTGLEEDASRICVSGGPGLGKTSLARALPKLLGNAARVAVLLDPTVSWRASRDSLARQWGIPDGRLSRAALVNAASDRRLVLTIDQAERASEEFLDHLDVVLSYRTADDQPVVQSVLLARLATHKKDEAPSPLAWWLDRIQTLQLEFAPMPRDGVVFYIQKHLKRAGWRGENLFDEAAAHAIHEYSGGVPGDISSLCEQLLVEAAEHNLAEIDADFVHAICEPPLPEEEFENADGDTDEAEEQEAPCAADSVNELPTDLELTEAPETSLTTALQFFEAAAAKTAEDESDAPPCEAADDEANNAEPEPDETFEWASVGDAVDAVLPEEEESNSYPEADEDPQSFEDTFAFGPASEAELLEIRGSRFSRLARPVTFAAIAALLGGLAFNFLNTDAIDSTRGTRQPAQAAIPAAAIDDAHAQNTATRSPRAPLRTPITGVAGDNPAPAPLILFEPAGGFFTPNAAPESEIAEGQATAETLQLAATDPEAYAEPQTVQSESATSPIEDTTNLIPLDEASPGSALTDVTLSGVEYFEDSSILDAGPEENIETSPAAPAGDLDDDL